ncbi:MAG: response regulator [Bryobacteraceae bacterium]
MSPAKPARIMLVEDNPGDIFLVERALRERGLPFELSCFEDGQSAVKALIQQGCDTPDLILLDLNLPALEGVAVLRTIRNLPKLAETPVAILTSSESPRDMEQTALIGASRFITKPAKPDEFVREVGSAIGEMLRITSGIE